MNKKIHVDPRNHGWVSLSNIIFAPGSLGHIALPLVSPWVGYGGSFGTPDYTAPEPNMAQGARFSLKKKPSRK